MKNIDTASDADVYALDCIRSCVRRLAGSRLVPQDELEDVCNDVYCEFLKRKPRFDPSRGSQTTFTSCVVRNLVASVARTRIEFRRRYSLAEYSETTAVADLHGAHFTRGTVGVLDLQISVRDAVNTLPDDLRRLANAMYTESLTEISESTGKSRSSLYVKRAAIRSHFERLGLGSSTLTTGSTSTQLRQTNNTSCTNSARCLEQPRPARRAQSTRDLNSTKHLF